MSTLQDAGLAKVAVIYNDASGVLRIVGAVLPPDALDAVLAKINEAAVA